MDQWDRDELELGKEVRSGLRGENDRDPRLRELDIRNRVRHAQTLADIRTTFGKVNGS